MTAVNDIRDIFSIFHDGTITTWTGDKDLLTLTISCKYLAERIDKSFDEFYIKLENVSTVELDPWPFEKDMPTVVKTEIADIFRAELEIISADIQENKVVVTCSQHDNNFDYCGGNLTISARAIKLLDQSEHPLTVDELWEICKAYWAEFRNK
ncbi:hypothetical protein [Chitinophaga sp. sic0106]|uniref:hypothetical protein n=1 Tax=Chitinophaga sp. sic0106 TaxID=2854785 RepID=UPI001C4599B3|nr:hypothetical protein [Chitinophaga sp. sic0106]MBV7532904.1 hypothetical protein [Chitinophaga sp. sic0106]